MTSSKDLNLQTASWRRPANSASTAAGSMSMLLHEGFERHARHMPEAVALVVGTERVSYGELDARANRLAQRLQNNGIRPGDRVGLCAGRDANLYIGILGILKAGAAYVPIDPDYPAERRAFIVRDSRCRSCVTSGVESVGLPDDRVDLLADADDIAPLPAEAVHTGPDPDSAAYVIYTSGTTGTPKGVPIRHGQVAVRIATMSALYEIEPGDRVLQFASVVFDASIEQMFTALNSGAALIARPDAWSIDSVLAIMEMERVTIAEFTPIVWDTVVRQLTETATMPPTALSRVITGGDRIEPKTVKRWFELCDIPLFNTYGPTETTITATARRFDHAEPSIAIGTPVRGVSAHVVNESGAPVAAGESGELWLSGPGTADGYLDRPDLTAARFVAGPDSERAYRTGDRVRWNHGELDFLGRLDDQVQIGGVRVEPGEVAVVLTDHPEVCQSHVEVRRLQGQATLIAHVVPQDHRQIPSARRLRAYLAEKLPVAMIPGYYTIVEQLPLLVSGKVDRAALAEIAIAPPRFDGDFVEPAPGLEERLAGYWAEELGVERVGSEDDLVTIGAHSLRTMRIAVRIARSERVDLSVAELLAAATVRAQAAMIAERRGGPRRFPALRQSDAGRSPMSEQQKQVWFLSNLDPSNASYRFQAVIRVSGAFDLDVVDLVITELHRRHPILRTTYSEDGEGFWQHLHPQRSVTARRVDLRELAETERRAAADSQVRDAISAPLDLTELPLQKWTIIQIGNEQFELVLVESHMVHDGWSFTLLMREFTELYNAFLSGQPSPLLESTLGYGDYAAWQQRELSPDGSLATQLDSWRRHFADVTSTDSIMPDFPRPARMRHNGDVVRVDLPGALPDRIRAFCRENRVTLFEMLFAAFGVYLSHHTRQTDLCVGSAFANRRLPDTQDIVGMFVNTVLLRVSIDPDGRFEDVVREVQREMHRADDIQEVPFTKVVHALNPERSATANPFTQVMFSAHDSALPELTFGDASGSVSYPPNQSAKFDLNVIVLPAKEASIGHREMADQRITMDWEFNSDLFTEATVERMAARYVNLLEHILTGPALPMSDIPLIGEDEKRELAALGVAPCLSAADPTAFPAHARAVDRVAAWARDSPDTEAVRDDTGALTYREFNEVTDALARVLLRRGLGPDTVVGVHVERGRDLPIAAIAAHKARCAYAPIDPAAPPERVAAMLDGVELVLCSESTRKCIPRGAAEAVVIAEAVDSGRALVDSLPEAGMSDLAYVIHTSGSTGAPKGVMVEQQNLSNLVEWSTNELPLEHGAVVPFVASQSFDASVWEMWRILAVGATCLVTPDRVRTSPDELVEWLRDNRVTHCFLPTVLAVHLLHHHRDSLPDLQWLGVGGDRLELPVGATLPFKVSNLYGPAETSVIATTASIPAGTTIGADLANVSIIGRPIAGVEVMVVNESGRQVPIGVPGELWIGGRGVGRGYCGVPSEAAGDGFVLRTGADGRETRFYRSGDLVRWNVNGELECLGRLDRQVKLRGYRIELGEIEAALRAKTSVKDCAVLHRPADGNGSGASAAELVAYVVPPADQALDAGTMRAALKDRLPGYMIPSAFVSVDAVPLTVNGKVDIAALSAGVGKTLAHSAGTMRPRDEFESIIAEMWAEALSIDSVGVHDNFFDLGGHSMLATQLINRLEHRTGIRLSLREIYESPTVAQMKLALLDRVVAGE